MDLTQLAPTVGIGALLLYTLSFMWKEVGDRRRFEAQLRAEFAEERAQLRAQCAGDRELDRARIVALELEVSRLMTIVEGRHR